MNSIIKSLLLHGGDTCCPSGETHVDFDEVLAEEEHGAPEAQLGRGVGAGVQPLVPGCLPEVEQLAQLQGPGRQDASAQQQAGEEPQEPVPGHLLSGFSSGGVTQCKEADPAAH